MNKLAWVLLLLAALLLINIGYNTAKYIQNQSLLYNMIDEYGLGNGSDFDKASAATELTYTDIKLRPSPGSSTFVCRTPRKILAAGGNCGDHVLFEVSLLDAMGIDAHPLGLTHGRGDDSFKHVVVEANIDGGWLVFDPLYNQSPGLGSKELTGENFDAYVKSARETGLEYDESWNFDNTERFRYGIFGPFEGTAEFFGKIVNKLGYDIRQPYFMLRCRLRSIVFSFLGLIAVLGTFFVLRKKKLA